MTPTERTLQVLEYIMAAGPGPIKQVDIARECKMSPATLNRIIRILSEWGYLFRTSEKYCVRNFRLNRNVPMSESYLAELDRTIKQLTDTLQVSAEIVVVAGHELLWHSKTEHPDQTVFIRANVGFRRSLYELDALSRLYLSRLDPDELATRFYMDGFYETHFRTGRDIQQLSEDRARSIIAAAAEDDFEFDLEGNNVGIRRCATVVSDPKSGFLHLLAIAEPVRQTDDLDDHIGRYREALNEARDRLMQIVAKEQTQRRRPPVHHAAPGRGG
ncbi:MarR family transcriptional regulator [Tianweitania sp. BSSL-BM11]|uniref:MarR family transcriptional regulator n=1 Tax=Tianweitania aestuarii TaxID=2814886 RepID=A0ABS5RQX7_9HYPH|nr:MarR family transcriptional regulator [Tianweitania aestuarii]MBS9719448.1 MarR family transcriptional regulator [Tianweitania aestuarii]